MSYACLFEFWFATLALGNMPANHLKTPPPIVTGVQVIHKFSVFQGINEGRKASPSSWTNSCAVTGTSRAYSSFWRRAGRPLSLSSSFHCTPPKERSVGTCSLMLAADRRHESIFHSGANMKKLIRGSSFTHFQHLILLLSDPPTLM